MDCTADPAGRCLLACLASGEPSLTISMFLTLSIALSSRAAYTGKREKPHICNFSLYRIIFLPLEDKTNFWLILSPHKRRVNQEKM